MLSSESFHVVNDEQTPLAHAPADAPPAAVLVVGLPPPPPHAAARSTSTATAAPPRRRDDIAHIRSGRRLAHQEARTSPGDKRASLLLCSPLSLSRSRSPWHRSRTSSGSRSCTARSGGPRWPRTPRSTTASIPGACIRGGRPALNRQQPPPRG